MTITPFKARLIAGAFASLAVAITVNVMVMQPDDPTRSARTLSNGNNAESASLHLSEAPTRRSRRRVDYASRGDTLRDEDRGVYNPKSEDTWNHTDENAASRLLGEAEDVNVVDELPTLKLVRSIQAELTRRGYAPGPIDGITGVITQAAIMAYEFDNKFPVTGTTTPALLKHMLLGQGGRRPRSLTSGPVSRATAARITRAVQKTLADLGYAPGPAHGRLGRELKAAIREFETDRKLVATGRISGKLIAALNKATGVSFARAVR